MAQRDDAQLAAAALVIKNETTPNANTANRVGTLFQDLSDSKRNKDTLIPLAELEAGSLGKMVATVGSEARYVQRPLGLYPVRTNTKRNGANRNGHHNGASRD